MSDATIRESISAHYDGELTLDELLVEVRETSQVQDDLAAYQQLHSTVLELPGIDPSTDLEERIFRNMNTTTIHSDKAADSHTRALPGWLKIAAVLLVAAGLAVFFLFGGRGKETPIGFFTRVAGNVRIVHEGMAQLTATGASISEGDRVVTALTGEAELELSESSALLRADSAVRVKSAADLEFEYGDGEFESTTGLQIETRHGAIELNDAHVRIRGDSNNTHIEMLRGESSVRTDREIIHLREGESQTFGALRRSDATRDSRSGEPAPSIGINEDGATTGAISGTITSSTGAPIIGASIELYPTNIEPGSNDMYAVMMLSPRKLGEAKSGQNGYYVVQEVEDGEYALFVRASGYSPIALTRLVVEDGGHVSGIDLSLSDSRPFLLRTINESGEPVPNTPIRHVYTVDSRGMRYFFMTDKLTTDGQGELLLDLGNGENGYLMAMPDEYVHATTEYPLRGGSLDWVLMKGRTVSGRLLDAEGNPISGADVYAQRLDSRSRSPKFTQCVSRSRSDRRGEFAFVNIPDGTLYVVARIHENTPEYLTGETGPLEVAGEAVTDVSVELKPGSVVSGIVRDASGNGVRGVDVAMVSAVFAREENDNRIHHMMQQGIGREALFDFCQTDENGQFRISAQGAGKHALLALEWSPRISKRAAAATLELPSATPSVELTLEELALWGHQEGRVIKADGSAAFPALLSLKMEFDGGSKALSAGTDQNGRFRLDFEDRDWMMSRLGLKPRANGGEPDDQAITTQYQYEVTTPEGYSGSLEFEAPKWSTKTDLLIQLSEGGTIAGNIRDAAGFPVVDAVVGIVPTGPGDYRLAHEYRNHWTRTDSAGQFLLRGLNSDLQYHVAVRADGLMRSHVSGVVCGATGIALTLKPAATIRGVIVDDDGRPISGVEAKCYAWSGNNDILDDLYSEIGNDVDRTDSKGRFDLSVTNISVDGKVKAYAYESTGGRRGVDVEVSVEPGVVHEGVRLELRGSAKISGRVIDIQTREPVAGAEIYAFGRDNMARTDKDGQFVVDEISGNTLQLNVRAEGYALTGDTFAPAIHESVKPGYVIEDILVELTPESVVRGVIVGTDGNPLAGIRVSVSGRWHDYTIETSTRGPATGRTGEFQIHGSVPGEKLRLSFSSQGNNYVLRSGQNNEVVVPDYNAENTSRFVLERVARASGRITDMDGNPVELAKIRFIPTDGTGSENIHASQVDEDRFSLGNLPSCKGYLTADAPGFAATQTEPFTLAEGEHRDDILIRLRPSEEKGHHVIVRLDLPPGYRMSSGTGMLTIRWDEYHRSGHNMKWVNERDLGKPFLLEVHDESITRVNITASLPDLTPATLEDVEVPADLTLHLKKSGSLVGKVVDEETGDPVKAYTVTVWRHDLSGVTNEMTRKEFSQGTFSIDDAIGELDMDVTVLANGYLPERLARIQGAPEETIDLGTIRLKRGHTLPGRVLNESGEPVAGADVRGAVEVGNSNITSSLWGRATSDENGEFELSGMMLGTLKVDVRSDDYAPLKRQSVLVGPETLRDGVELTLTKGGSIEVTIYNNLGKPVDKARVLVDVTDVYTAADGIARFDCVSPGDRNLWVSEPFSTYESGRIEVREGEITVVEWRPGEEPNVVRYRDLDAD